MAGIAIAVSAIVILNTNEFFPEKKSATKFEFNTDSSKRFTLVVRKNTDADCIKSGYIYYFKNCKVCHSTNNNNGTGPGLKDVTKKRTMDWLIKFTKDNIRFSKTNTIAAKVMFETPSAMTAFEGILTDEDIECIFKYVDSVNEAKGK